MHKRRSDELDYETHKQTSDYDTISYNNRKENSWNNAENKYASYHQFQKMLPLSEFSLNNPSNFY